VCANAVVDVIEYQTSGDAAAFIAERLLGEGGIMVPHPDYFQRLRSILDPHGILLIIDDVQTRASAAQAGCSGIEHYGVAT